MRTGPSTATMSRIRGATCAGLTPRIGPTSRGCQPTHGRRPHSSTAGATGPTPGVAGNVASRSRSRDPLRVAAPRKEAAASMETATAIEPTFFRTASGALVNATFTLTRAELTELARPFVDRALEDVGATLEQASLK